MPKLFKYPGTVCLHHKSCQLFVDGVEYKNFKEIDLDRYLECAVDIVFPINRIYGVVDRFNLKEDDLIDTYVVALDSLEVAPFEFIQKYKPTSYYPSDSDTEIYFLAGNRREKKFYRYNLKTNIGHSIPACGSIVTVKENLVLFSGKNLVAYDKKGCELWRFNRKKVDRIGDYAKTVLLHKDMVIFTQAGEARQADSVIALNMNTGKKCWSYNLAFPARRIVCESGRLCLSTGNRMLVLEPNQGKPLGEFTANVQDGFNTLLWFDGDFYYVIDGENNCLQAYNSSSFKMETEWWLPNDFCPHINGYPIKRNDKNYLLLWRVALADTGVYGGVLTWSSEDVVGCKKIEYDQASPPVEVDVLKERSGEAYRIKVDTPSIHSLLRYGEIEVKRVAATYGKQIWERDTLNSNFNGHIELVVNSGIGKENEKYLNALAERCEFFGRLHGVNSGRGKKPIKVTWRFDN